jgi:hypothetical protein
VNHDRDGYTLLNYKLFLLLCRISPGCPWGSRVLAAPPSALPGQLATQGSTELLPAERALLSPEAATRAV